ncbi:transcriptional repressor MprA [Photorhabdus sp. SF281]|uniref:transcriptional repressor MprA n=1 Tax=Photorhabdus sp. SF281 TaxID=3459527 RepID=UPI0040451991
MESSFTPTEELLNIRAAQQAKLNKDIPYQEILLTRLSMHVQSKLLENRNNMLKAQGINETLFMALMILDTKESHSIQPSELSAALGSSRTNATRIADELEKQEWIERKESHNDRRCLHLHLTDQGTKFLNSLLPPQHDCLRRLWSCLDLEEQKQLEKLMRKLLVRLDTMGDCIKK